jgi:hypothetical protein
MPVCPACGEPVILPSRADGNNVLFLASHPTEMEWQMKRQNSGNLGQLVRKEFLNVAKIDPFEFSRAFLYWHPKDKKMNPSCLEVSVGTLLAEYVSDTEFIILVGADAVEWGTGYAVSDVSGLDVTAEFKHKSSFPKLKKVIASVAFTMAFVKGVGEVRFAVSEFAKMYRENQTMRELGF